MRRNQLRSDWINDCISTIIQYCSLLLLFLIAKLIKSLILFVLLHLEFMARCNSRISSPFLQLFGMCHSIFTAQAFRFSANFLNNQLCHSYATMHSCSQFVSKWKNFPSCLLKTCENNKRRFEKLFHHFKARTNL